MCEGSIWNKKNLWSAFFIKLKPVVYILYQIKNASKYQNSLRTNFYSFYKYIHYLKTTKEKVILIRVMGHIHWGILKICLKRGHPLLLIRIKVISLYLNILLKSNYWRKLKQ